MNIVIKFRETIRETFRANLKAAAVLTMLFCANLPNFAQTCMEKKAKICILNVEVLVDNIQEKGISSQIFEMAKAALNARNLTGRNYSLSIDLSERSFFKNIENSRSLYTHYQLFTEEGECVWENVFCSEGKNSIVSTLVQQRQIEKIARDLKKYFANESKNDA